MIYEARLNVTRRCRCALHQVGNVVVLRGGSTASIPRAIVERGRWLAAVPACRIASSSVPTTDRAAVGDAEGRRLARLDRAARRALAR